LIYKVNWYVIKINCTLMFHPELFLLYIRLDKKKVLVTIFFVVPKFSLTNCIVGIYFGKSYGRLFQIWFTFILNHIDLFNLLICSIN